MPLALGACAAVLVVVLLGALSRLNPFLGVTAAVAGGIVIGWAGHRQRQRIVGEARADEWANALPPGYRILHDVELSGVTADHLVIAPTGVWVIITRSQRGTVQLTTDGLTVDGRRLLRDPRRHAQTAASAVRTLLRRETGTTIRVQPLVCFTRATLGGVGGAGDTPVLGWQAMLARLRRGPHSIPAATRARIRRALARGNARSAHPRIRLVDGISAASTR